MSFKLYLIKIFWDSRWDDNFNFFNSLCQILFGKLHLRDRKTETGRTYNGNGGHERSIQNVNRKQNEKEDVKN